MTRARRCNKPGEISVPQSLQEEAGELVKGEAIVRGIEGSAGLCRTPRMMLLPSGVGQLCASAGKSLCRGVCPCVTMSLAVPATGLCTSAMGVHIKKFLYKGLISASPQLLLKLRDTAAQVKNTDIIFFSPASSGDLL